MMKKFCKSLMICSLSLIMCLSVGVAMQAKAVANPDVYDYASLFSYTKANGSFSSSEGIIHNTAHWGSSALKIVSDGVGLEANNSGAKMNAVFDEYVEFTFNAIPKTGATTANDYAYRVLKVRFASADEPANYFDYVIHNKHSWVAAPSVYPNDINNILQGALSFVEFNNKKTGDLLGTEVPNWSFGGPIQGGFCGSSRITSNINIRFDLAKKQLIAQDGSASGLVFNINQDTFGKDFVAERFTVEFIFDEVEANQNAGIVISNIKSQYYADMWTNTDGSKTNGSKPIIKKCHDFGLLGDFGENSATPNAKIDFDTTKIIEAIDFETGLYKKQLADASVSLYYSKANELTKTKIDAVPFVAPSVYGSYDIVAVLTDNGGDLSESVKIASFEVPALLNIKLVGASEVTVEVKNPIEDEGAIVTSSDTPTPIYTSNFSSVDFNTLGNYTVTYSVTDSNNNSVSVNRIIKVVDTQAPIITLNGENTIIIDKDSSFTDPSATATDNYDTSVSVSVEGIVEPSVIGNYTLKYTATDTSGNTTQLSRKVYVANPASSGIYDYSKLFTYNKTVGEWGGNEDAIVAQTYGATSFNVMSEQSGAQANNSSAKLKGVFTNNVEFVLNPIAKSGAKEAEDFAYRVLRVRFANAENPLEYFDYVIHNKHAWLAAPSVYPNSTLKAQGALSYIEYNGVRKSSGDPENSSGMPVENLPFGGPMAGGFCGNTRVDTNMRFRYDIVNNSIYYYANATQELKLLSIDESTFGSNFNAKNVTVEFIFDEVVSGERAGVSIAMIKSEYGEMLTENRGTKVDGVAPIVRENAFVGNLGNVKPNTDVNVSSDEKVVAIDFETGYYSIGLDSQNIKLFYKQKSGAGEYTPVENIFKAPTVEGDYELFLTLTDSNGTSSLKSKLGAFVVTNRLLPLVVTVNGKADVTVEVKGVLEDLGATAIDENGQSYPVESNFSQVVDLNNVGIYVVTYTAIDTANDNAVVSATRIVNVVDTTLPIITLKGDAVVTLKLGDTYLEAGCDVSDNYDEQITATVSGDVNTNQKGEYIITYTAIDASGNKEEITRIVKVIDDVKPVITLGDKITSGVVNSKITIATSKVTDNSGEKLDCSVTVTFSDGTPVDIINNEFTPTKEGVYTVTYKAQDSSGKMQEESYTIEISGAKKNGCQNVVQVMVMLSLFGAVLFIKRK